MLPNCLSILVLRMCRSRLDVTAQPSRSRPTIVIVHVIRPWRHLQTVVQVFTSARPNVRSTQRSLLLCDIAEPHLYVEGRLQCGLSWLHAQFLPSILSLRVHHEDLCSHFCRPKNTRAAPAPSTETAVKLSAVQLLGVTHMATGKSNTVGPADDQQLGYPSTFILSQSQDCVHEAQMNSTKDSSKVLLFLPEFCVELSAVRSEE